MILGGECRPFGGGDAKRTTNSENTGGFGGIYCFYPDHLAPCIVWSFRNIHLFFQTHARIQLAAGIVGSSPAFTSDRANGRMRESLWDLVYYAFSWLVLFLRHPVAILTACLWLAVKAATAPGSEET